MIEQSAGLITQPTRFRDWLTPTGWDRIGYKHGVMELSAALEPYAKQLADLTEVPKEIFHTRQEREGVGPLIRTITARKNYDRQTVIRAYENDLTYIPEYSVKSEDRFNRLRGAYFTVACEGYEVAISGRVVQSIKVGSRSATDNPRRSGSSDYVLGSNRMEALRPDLVPLNKTLQKTAALQTLTSWLLGQRYNLSSVALTGDNS